MLAGPPTRKRGSGSPIAAAALERLLCDGNIEWSVDGPDGAALGIGRASRAWPAWLARLIRRRDGNRCRWPGCDSGRRLRSSSAMSWSDMAEHTA